MKKLLALALMCMVTAGGSAVCWAEPGAQSGYPPVRGDLVVDGDFLGATYKGESHGTPATHDEIKGWLVRKGKAYILWDGADRVINLDGDSSLVQTIATQPGHTYEMVCLFRCASAGGPDCSLIIHGGAQQQTFTMKRPHMEGDELVHRCIFKFAATGTSTLIEFQSGEHDYHGPQLVRVVCVQMSQGEVTGADIARQYDAFTSALMRHSARYVVAHLTADFSAEAAGGVAQTRAQYESWLTDLASRPGATVRYKLNQGHADGDNSTAQVQRTVSWTEDGHSHQIVSACEDTWHRVDGEWSLGHSTVSSEKVLIDGQEVTPTPSP